MDRPIVFSQEMLRAFDHLSGWQDSLKGIGLLASDVFFGSAEATGNPTQTIVTGFSATPSGSGLIISLGAGSIYQIANLDTNAYGSLNANTFQVYQQGYVVPQTVTLSVSGIPSSGQSQFALIEATFSQSDAIRSGDPNSGILPYYNASSPTQPLQGPLNNAGTLNTVRQGTVSIRVLYGAAATGTPTVPGTDAGYVPLYYVLLSFGESTIATSTIYPGIQFGAPNTAIGQLAQGFSGGYSSTGVIRPVARQTVGVTVSNSASTTQLFLGKVLPFPTTNSSLRFTFRGTLTNATTASQSITWTITFGGSTIVTGTPTFSASVTAAWILEGMITNQNVTNSQFVHGQLTIANSGSTAGALQSVASNISLATNVLSIDTTINNNVILSNTLGTASTNLSLTLNTVLIELIP